MLFFTEFPSTLHPFYGAVDSSITLATGSVQAILEWLNNTDKKLWLVQIKKSVCPV